MVDGYAPLAFVDTETTGLDAEYHEIWEAAVATDAGERRWFLPVDLGRADPFALRIGKFHERHPHGHDYKGNRDEEWVTDLDDFARDFADRTRGCHLVGAVPSFDEERLRKLLKANGACPEWHYHLIDVEALACGALAVLWDPMMDGEPVPHLAPWKSEDLSGALGINPDHFDRHTAMGDVHWARAIYQRITDPAWAAQKRLDIVDFAKKQGTA